jgi:hypothetical protein
MITKIVNPTKSYNIMLPDDIKEDYNDIVMSFWREGGDLLLQLSSHKRESGDQVEAQDRLKAKIESVGGEWKPYELSIEGQGEEQRISGAYTKNENGIVWLHVYLTWPNLMIYATISGKHEVEVLNSNWALDAIQKIKRTS